MYRKFFKYILILSCCIFFASSLSAQRFKAGLIAGINLSQLDGDDLAGYNKLGLNVGGRVVANLQGKWDASLELLLSQKGSRFNNKDGFSIYERIHLNYVEAPVMINFSDWLQEEEDYYKINFSAGFSFARLFDFEVTQFDGVDLTDSRVYKRNTFNLLIGATYFATKNIGVNFRASWSILNLEETQNFEPLRSKSISFRTIYMF